MLGGDGAWFPVASGALALVGSLLPLPAAMFFSMGTWGETVGDVLFKIVVVSAFCIPISVFSGFIYLFYGTARRQAWIGIGLGFGAVAVWILSAILLFVLLSRTPGCC